MMILVITIHVIVCVGLIGVVLVQRGRGGGLVESFSGVEAMWGTRTSQILTRSTTIMSVVFFLTCLTLAAMSVRQSKSLMNRGGLKIQPVAAEKQAETASSASATAQETSSAAGADAQQAAVTTTEPAKAQ